MPKFVAIEPLSKEALDSMGFVWHNDEDGEYVIKDKLIAVSEVEADAYYEATQALYDMYEAGAEYVIKNELFELLNIPKNLIDPIKKSWKQERENHLYGRFDLSGGIDGKPIKLIEFNADTPTLLLESSVIQWMLLENSSLENKKQFNNIYESIGEKLLSMSLSCKGEFTKFLFSAVKEIEEETITTKLLAQMAKDKGLTANFTPLEDMAFEDAWVVDERGNPYDLWFKLFPWEDMLAFEGKLETKVINPAFTLLYQSKGMLAILYKLFPESPYLLKTSFEPIQEKYVKKRMFGREGANIDIVEGSETLLTTGGIYEEYSAVYQEYVDFIRDEEGLYYQAGVFYSDKPCGLGFRRGAEILDDMSQFVGHFIQEQ
jgi:glutathionylspermidine synthase